MAADSKPPQLSPQIIEQMLRQQGQQLEIRMRELQLQEKNIDQQAKYAGGVLQAQADDLKDQRTHQSRKTGWKIVAGVISLMLILVFLTTCILTGHETAAIEIVKAVVFLAGGGGVGYTIGRSKRDQSPPSEPSE